MPTGRPSAASGLGQGEFEVVVEDHDRPQLRLEAAQGRVELVAVRAWAGPVGDGDIGQRCELHLDDPTPTVPGRVEAGVDGQSMEPGVEPVRVAQPGQVPPGPHHRLLDRVARELRVPEDESGGRVQARERHAGEHGEGVMIAPPRLLHEGPLVHGHPPFWRDRSGRAHRVWRRRARIRSRRFAPHVARPPKRSCRPSTNAAPDRGGVAHRSPRRDWASTTRSMASLTQPLARVAARAEDAGSRGKRLATEDERHRMVGREVAGADRVRLAMPAVTAPTVARHPGLDRPLRP